MIPLTTRVPKNDLVEVEAPLNGSIVILFGLMFGNITRWVDLECMMPVSGCMITARKERYIGIASECLLGWAKRWETVG